MAGKPKLGMDYLGWPVAMFDNDERMDMLLDTHGWKGFGIYFFLCQRAAGSGGYYYKWSYASCASTARKMGGGIGSETVREVVKYCLQIGLFDEGLFDRWGILTSRDIQERFWPVLSTRRVKVVYQEYWLLDDEECQGLKKVTVLSANHDLQDTNEHSLSANATKRSVVKRSVVKRREDYATPEASSVLSNELAKLYTSEIGEISNVIEKELVEAVNQHGAEEVIRAVKIAVENGKRTLAYIKGILKHRNDTNKSKDQGRKNSFLNYTQRDDIDYDELERELASRPIKNQEE